MTRTQYYNYNFVAWRDIAIVIAINSESNEGILTSTVSIKGNEYESGSN
jgi:hypothetical protein